MPTRKRIPSRKQPQGHWIRIHTGMMNHPKITRAGKPEALALAVIAISISAENGMDGEFDLEYAMRIACVDETVGKALIVNDVFHHRGHDCPRCKQPREGLHIVHDFLDWQQSAAEGDAEAARRAEISAKRAEYGSRGGKKRVANVEAAKLASTGTATPSASPAPTKKRVARKKAEQLALEVMDHETAASNSLTGTLTSSSGDTEPEMLDDKTREKQRIEAEAMRLCKLLADKMQERRGRAPVMTESGWYTPMRLMLTRDGLSSTQIEYLIGYSTDLTTKRGCFWAPNIESAKKLRIRKNRLIDEIQALKASRNLNKRGPMNGHRNAASPEDRLAQDDLEMAALRNGRRAMTPDEELWKAA